MRTIIDCDPEYHRAATALLSEQLYNWRERYTRMGWGWAFGAPGAQFFVRRIKDGLSVTQIEPKRQIREPRP